MYRAGGGIEYTQAAKSPHPFPLPGRPGRGRIARPHRDHPRPFVGYPADSSVIAASRPVKAFVPVQIRLVTAFGSCASRAPAERMPSRLQRSPRCFQRAVDHGSSGFGSGHLTPLRGFGGGEVRQAHCAESCARTNFHAAAPLMGRSCGLSLVIGSNPICSV
jgi:hypothetical protein